MSGLTEIAHSVVFIIGGAYLIFGLVTWLFRNRLVDWDMRRFPRENTHEPRPESWSPITLGMWLGAMGVIIGPALILVAVVVHFLR